MNWSTYAITYVLNSVLDGAIYSGRSSQEALADFLAENPSANVIEVELIKPHF